MHWDILQQIGLNKNEAKIYEALLDLGEASVSEIAAAGAVNRRNVYDALDNLRVHNLVSKVRGKSQLRYRPADPRKLSQIIQQQRQQAASVLPSLERVYRSHVPSEQVFISRGIEGIRNFWQYVLSQHGPAYFVGGKGAWHDPRIEEARKQYFSQAADKRIIISGIFDFTMRKNAADVTREYDRQQIRFFPEDYSTNATYDVCGDRVILFPMPGERDMANVTIYNIISQPLADSFRRWFQLLWQQAQPLQPATPTEPRSTNSKRSA